MLDSMCNILPTPFHLNISNSSQKVLFLLKSVCKIQKSRSRCQEVQFLLKSPSSACRWPPLEGHLHMAFPLCCTPGILLHVQISSHKHTSQTGLHAFLLSRFSCVQPFLQPYGLQPARLCCPSKNTGADCYALLWGNLPNPGIKPGSPTLQVDSLSSEPPGVQLDSLYSETKNLHPIPSFSVMHVRWQKCFACLKTHFKN